MQKRKVLLLIEYYLKFNEYPPKYKGYNHPIYQRLICKSLRSGNPIKIEDIKESIVNL